MAPPNQDSYSSNEHLESLGNSFYLKDNQSSLKLNQMSHQKERGKQPSYHQKSSRTRYVIVNSNPEQSATASGPVTFELFKYLGGLHSSLAALSILTLITSRKDPDVSLNNEKMSLLVLGIASGSTTWFDLRQTSVWDRSFYKERRGVFNLLVALMNAVAYLRSVKKSRSLF
ncbi:7852_t:CDS:2 [Ambispora leptoticha]|uniref:7852_t:CDS:1 n=1 Tax=Ambispora leptoticha TaxID=144679 RepID=A0A9N8WF81_9GLOM|nr:7852_t:CDS:2 [Ambispora leptoticha]